jgi:hypothetical protein
MVFEPDKTTIDESVDESVASAAARLNYRAVIVAATKEFCPADV